MKTMIVYASWFGHNRAIARALARELADQGVTVICAPVSKITTEAVTGLDLLVLGSYTHGGQANRQLLRLCDAVPHQRLDHMAVGVFGTQSAEELQAGEPGGVDDLIAHVEARGLEIVIPPLRIGLQGAEAFLPWQGIGEQERGQVKSFAKDLLEACVPAPFV